jgi:hypothetical protein
MAIDEIVVVDDLGPRPGQTGNAHTGNAHARKYGEKFVDSPPSRSRVVLEEVG